MTSEETNESRACLACGSTTAEIVPLMIICERADYQEGWGVTLNFVPITVQEAKVVGRDVYCPAPVFLCQLCQERLLPSRTRLTLRASRPLLAISGFAFALFSFLFFDGKGLIVWPPILIGGSIVACLIHWRMTRHSQGHIKHVLRQSPDLTTVLDRFPNSVVAVARPGMERLDDARVV
jgi:hypothetical protein